MRGRDGTLRNHVEKVLLSSVKNQICKICDGLKSGRVIEHHEEGHHPHNERRVNTPEILNLIRNLEYN